MTDQTQTPSQEQVTSSEPTLDDVYKTYNVEETAKTFQPEARPQPQQVQEPIVPDPALDPEGFKRYETERFRDQNLFRHALSQVIGKLGEFESTAAKQREEHDIRQAVDVIKEKNPDMDDDFIEVALGAKARKDPKFLNVWNSRQQNPKAWGEALKAYSNEMAGKFSIKADPQLAENQRAMKTAQQTMATAPKELDINDQLGKLQGSEFDRAMDRIKNGMSPF